MAMKFTKPEAIAGEMALRGLSARAAEIYSETDPLHIYERDGALYIRGAISLNEATIEQIETALLYLKGEIKMEYTINVWAAQYDFPELLSAATAPDATQVDLNNLGKWFQHYGMEYWNGEYFDVDGKGTLCLYPINVEVDEDWWYLAGYELR